MTQNGLLITAGCVHAVAGVIGIGGSIYLMHLNNQCADTDKKSIEAGYLKDYSCIEMLADEIVIASVGAGLMGFGVGNAALAVTNFASIKR